MGTKGMSANADIQTKTQRNVITVPINAVTTRDKNDTTGTAKKKNKDDETNTSSSSADEPEVVVFVKGKDNKVSRIPVKTGIQDINYIEITGGLKGGEEVITGPYDVVSKTLKKGKQVKVVDKKELFTKKD